MTVLARFPRRLSLWLALATLAGVVNHHAHSTPLTAFVLLTIVLLPGLGLVDLVGVDLYKGPRFFVGLASGLTIAMITSALASGIGEMLKVDHPLGLSTQAIAFGAVLVIEYILYWVTGSDPLSELFFDVSAHHVATLSLVAFVPALAALGAGRLDHTGHADLAASAMAIAVGSLLVAMLIPLRRAFMAGVIYSSSLAILLATTLRGDHLYGWDIQGEYGVAAHALRAGVWHIPRNHDAYASMLSLTTLPVSFHSLTGLSLQAFFRVVVPMLLAMVPLGMFWLITSPTRPFATRGSSPRLGAGIVTTLIIASAVFPAEMPAIGRQSMATFLIVAALIVIFSDDTAVRRGRVLAGFLLMSLAWTHYSSSYALAAIFLLAWLFKAVAQWYQPGVAKVLRRQSRHEERANSYLSIGLVVVTLVAAFGWNMAFTKNNALTRPSGALVEAGISLQATTITALITPSQYQHDLAVELKTSAKWIEPFAGSSAVHLVSASAPSAHGVAPGLKTWWNISVLVAHEGIVIAEVLSVLFALWLFLRKRTTSIDLVSLALGGLALGVVLRVSGTAAEFFNPERGALITSIFAALPLAVVATRFTMSPRPLRAVRITTATIAVGISIIALCSAPNLATLVVGGTPPAALSKTGENVERFIITTPETGAAQWLATHVRHPDIVQTDRYGQLVLMSFPGTYNELPEIAPNEIDHRAYVYVTRTNLIDGRGRGVLHAGFYLSVFKYPKHFLDTHLYVVYSNGYSLVYF